MTIKEGIFFGMSDPAYRAIPAYNSSALKILKTEADFAKFWYNSHLNKEKVVKQKEAFEDGKLLHMLLLQPERFNREYNIVPGSSFDVDKKPISKARYELIKEKVDRIRLLDKNNVLFAGSYSEVVVVVYDEENGIYRKSMYDSLEVDYFTDFKSIKSVSREDVGYQVGAYGYDFQDRFYTENLIMIRDRIKKGKASVYADEGYITQDFIDRFLAKEEQPLCCFLFQEKERPFSAKMVTLPDSVFQNAGHKVQNSITLLKRGLEIYGETMWLELQPDGPEELDEKFIPNRYW